MSSDAPAPSSARPDAQTTDRKKQIDRLNQLSDLAGRSWLTLLGTVAFFAITLLSIEDLDFIRQSKTIPLPLLGIDVPNDIFLYLAPAITVILYLNLHLYLAQLWRAFMVCGGDRESDRLADQVNPWLINDYALLLMKDAAPRDHERAWIRRLIVQITIWWSVPLILAWVTYLSLPAGNGPLTSWMLACAVLSAIFGLRSWLLVQRQLAGRAKARSDWPNAIIFGLVASWALFVGWTFSGVTPGNPHGFAELANLGRPIDLRNKDLATKEKAWISADVQHESFRKSWCESKRIDLDVCAVLPAATPAESNALIRERRLYCERSADRPYLRLTGLCARFFADRDARFDADWKEARRAVIEGIPKLNLIEKTMPGLKAEEVVLPGTRFDSAWLTGARMYEANLEGASFRRANMEGVDGYNANLSFAELTQTNLSDANFEGADLTGAVLQGAILRNAKLMSSDLVGANLRGADLSGANLTNARLFRADLTGAILIDTNLTGALGLTREQLRDTIGGTGTRFSRPVIKRQDGATDVDLLTADCWTQIPEVTQTELIGGNTYFETAVGIDPGQFICGPKGPAVVGLPPPLKESPSTSAPETYVNASAN